MKEDDYRKTDAYEDLDTEERLSAYCIIEPGTSKRLQVKMVDKTRQALSCDASHIYFVLEPGSNKVTPIFQNIANGSGSLQMDSEHTYFVLEATAEEELPFVEAYAINDISTEPLYFVLEKQ